MDTHFSTPSLASLAGGSVLKGDRNCGRGRGKGKGMGRENLIGRVRASKDKVVLRYVYNGSPKDFGDSQN